MKKLNTTKAFRKIRTQRLLYLMAYIAELNKDGLMDDRTGHLTLQYMKDLGLAIKEMGI